MFQAMNGKIGKLIMSLSGLVVKIVQNKILCDDSSSCKEAYDSNDYHVS